MGVFNTCENQRIFSLPDGNFLLIEKHCTESIMEGGFDISLLRKEDLNKYGFDLKEIKVKKLPIAYESQITLSMYEWKKEYSELVAAFTDDVFCEFDFGKESNKVEKMLDKIIKKIRGLK